jgi:hypothetical protein
MAHFFNVKQYLLKYGVKVGSWFPETKLNSALRKIKGAAIRYLRLSKDAGFQIFAICQQ